MHLHAHENANPASKREVPYLLDVQADVLSDFATRVVAPLYPAPAHRSETLKVLTPLIRVRGRNYVMATQELAGIPRKLLGRSVADVSAQRVEITAALDLLLTGI